MGCTASTNAATQSQLLVHVKTHTNPSFDAGVSATSNTVAPTSVQISIAQISRYAEPIQSYKSDDMRAEEALYECIERGDFPEMVEEYVMKNKIDLNDCFEEGYTPLIVAAHNGRVKAARKLIDLGANVNATTPDGDSALIEAAFVNQLEVMTLLIEKGVDVNVNDNGNYTALMWASSAGHSDACSLLLKAGADVTVVNKEGYSCVDLAFANGFFNLARKLTAAGSKPQRRRKQKFKDATENKKQNTEGDFKDEESVDGKEESEEEPEETWLAPLLAECGTPAHLIYLCEERLVRQEGFGCAQTLAGIPTSLFTRAYLESLGIRGLGIRQVLLKLHAKLHHDYVQENRHQQQSQTGGAARSQPYGGSGSAAQVPAHNHRQAERMWFDDQFDNPKPKLRPLCEFLPSNYPLVFVKCPVDIDTLSNTSEAPAFTDAEWAALGLAPPPN